jgi:hypothetical protein
MWCSLGRVWCRGPASDDRKHIRRSVAQRVMTQALDLRCAVPRCQRTNLYQAAVGCCGMSCSANFALCHAGRTAREAQNRHLIAFAERKARRGRPAGPVAGFARGWQRVPNRSEIGNSGILFTELTYDAKYSVVTSSPLSVSV